MNKNQETDEDRTGRFGYEVVDGDECVPYIYRADEKFVSTQMFRWHLNRLTMKFKEPAIIDYSFAPVFDFTVYEADLCDKINRWHNDGLYRSATQMSDKLIKLTDVCDIFKFVNDCEQKSKHGELYEMCGGAGLIQIQVPSLQNGEWMDTVWPFILKDDERYVPVAFLNNLGDTLSAKIVLTGIDVMYMRYLYGKLKHAIPDDTLQMTCVRVQDAMKQLLGDDAYICDDSYWSTKERKPMPSVPRLVNNNLEFTEPVKISSGTMQAAAAITATAIVLIEPLPVLASLAEKSKGQTDDKVNLF